MRIIAGKHRGRVLAEFKGKEVRPTSDRVKESLFAILTPRLACSRVLDLFCGSGALGIECLSRGAREAVFNDRSKESVALLRKNLALVRENGIVYNLDYRTCLKTADGAFDLIFADPPYADDCLAQILDLVRERELLAENGLVVYESEETEEPSEGWIKADERRYGRTVVGFFRREEQ